MKKTSLYITIGVIVGVLIVLIAVGMKSGGKGIGKANKPHFFCGEDDEPCFDMLETYANSCNSSFFTINSTVLGYSMDIGQQSGLDCPLTMTITNSPFLRSMEGTSMDCEFPIVNGKVNVSIGSNPTGFGFTQHCKGELKTVLDDIAKNLPQDDD